MHLTKRLPELDLDDPRSYKEAMDSPFAPSWKAAMQDEIDSLGHSGTWYGTNLPRGKTSLSTKWVFTRKLVVSPSGDETIRYKARLVARGFEQKYGVDYKETFAPVIAHKTIRILLAMAAMEKCYVHQMDVKTAFLNGDVKEEIYISSPQGFTMSDLPNVGKPTYQNVLGLRKSLYGLKQAPLVWNSTISTFLTQKLGFYQSEEDPGLYIRSDLILALYVDDMLLFGRSLDTIQSVKNALSSEYLMSDLGEARRFLGMEITVHHPKTDDEPMSISVSQERYLVDILNRFGLYDCRGIDTPMMENGRMEKAPDNFEQDKENTSQYLQMLGCLMYAMTCTRPDLAFTMSHLSQFSSKPTYEHMKALKRVYHYLQKTKSLALVYRGAKPNEDPEKFRLHAYCDADWSGDKQERRSTSGYCVFLGGASVIWASRRQASTAGSSTEAEWISAALATEELLWVRHLLIELEYFIDPAHPRPKIPRLAHPNSMTYLNPSADELLPPSRGFWPTTVLYNDNQGACIIARNPEHHNKLKHVNIAYNITRRRCCGPLGTHELDMVKIDTNVNTADILTKPLKRLMHAKHVEGLGLTYVPH